ncbi:MAG: T9SS type A sorting domain-containing protein, partial [Bacteroidia bacterium]
NLMKTFCILILVFHITDFVMQGINTCVLEKKQFILDKIFFTDFNSFTNEYNGVFRLDNKDDLTDPIITKLIYAGTDTLNSPLINQVHDIEILGDSLVLFATDSGMVFFDGEKRWRTRSPKTNPIIDQWKIDQVSANSKGEFFMASGGIVYYENNDAWQKVDLTIKPYKLKNAQVKSIKKGTNDTMWVVTNLAVIKIINDSIIVWKNDEIKTLLNEVKDVAFDSIGNPWMIFELNGGIKFIDESTGEKVWRYINSTNSDLPDELSCVAADGNGRMWFGTDNSGLFKYKGFTPGSIGAQWPKDILLYPTLTSNGTVNINNTSNQTYSLELINLQGQTIGNFNLYNNQHHQLFLRPGTYILQANNGNTVSTKKIIVLGN